MTATRGAQPIADLLADVTVIGAEEIARAGVQSLAELLQRQPGIEITRNGGPAGVSGVFLRGANRGQTLVLIDGLRVGSASTGATTLEAIPLDEIERIEILRGPASSLYGADAIGGVIQVFTRRGGDAAGNGERQRRQLRDPRAQRRSSAAAPGPLRLSLQAAALASDGFNAIVQSRCLQLQPGSPTATAAATRPSISRCRSPTGRSWRRSISTTGRTRSSTAAPDSTTARSPRSRPGSSRAATGWRRSGCRGCLPAQSSDDSVSQTAFGDFPFDTRQTQFAWQNDFTLPLGLAHRRLRAARGAVATDVAFAVTSRDTNSVFAIYQWRDAVQALQANLRWDDSTQYGGKTTGALAYGYRVLPSLRLTAGRRPASRRRRSTTSTTPASARRTSRPRPRTTSRPARTGPAPSRAARVGARAIAYRNAVDQLIVFRCDASFNCTPSNVDQATLTGVTLALDASIGTLSLAGSLDLGNPRTTRPASCCRAARASTAHCRWRRPSARSASAPSSWHRRCRYDDAANTVRLAGYALVNLTPSGRAGRGHRLRARRQRVRRDYQLAADYSTGGAMVFAGLRWRL